MPTSEREMIQMTANFSSKTMEDRRLCQLRVLYPTKTSLKNESNMKTYINNVKLRESDTNTPTL